MLAITLQLAALSFTKDQYTSILLTLSLRNWLISTEDSVSPNGAPRSLDTSPVVAHCHQNYWDQGSHGWRQRCQ